MKKSRLIFAAVFFVCYGCVTTTSLNDRGRRVQLGLSDPNSSCKELGSLECPTTSSDRDLYEESSASSSLYGETDTINSLHEDSATSAKNKLRNMAAELGANYLRLESVSETRHVVSFFSASGTAYYCPEVDSIAENL